MADFLLAGESGGLSFDEAVEAADGSDVSEVLGLVDHPAGGVRLGVTQTLPFLTGGDSPTWEMVEAEIKLSADPVTDVRDWACCVLGSMWRDVDLTAVRDALAARLDDTDHDVRSEALLGLAYRHDPRALPRVREALSRPTGQLWRLELVAAGALGDPQLHELVLRYQKGWDDDDDVSPSADLVRRLTDPAGVGDEVIEGVAELYRRRAHGQPEGHAIDAWTVLRKLLDIAPGRAVEFLEKATTLLAGDEPAETPPADWFSPGPAHPEPLRRATGARPRAGATGRCARLDGGLTGPVGEITEGL